MGATTENPSFSLNSALLSRCKVLTLKKLPFDAMMTILKKAANSSDEAVVVESVALEYLANIADGDARMALNNLEAVLSWAKETSKLKITVAETKIGVSRGHLRYDQKGDEHYHCASALQKSIRGSDENAAIYWTMRMFDAGEDPLFIARRFIRIAGEDVGLADPAALNLAVSTMQGCQLIGKPECNVLLAQCAIYLARAPKSHEVMMAMGKVSETLKSSHSLPPIPIHLRNANSKLDRDAGYGAGYSYNLSKVKSISYMPEGMTEVKFL
jgi:putative ATPase